MSLTKSFWVLLSLVSFTPNLPLHHIRLTVVLHYCSQSHLRSSSTRRKNKKRNERIERLFQINSSSFKLFSARTKTKKCPLLFFNISYFNVLFCHAIIVNILSCCTTNRKKKSVIIHKAEIRIRCVARV